MAVPRGGTDSVWGEGLARGPPFLFNFVRVEGTRSSLLEADHVVLPQLAHSSLQGLHAFAETALEDVADLVGLALLDEVADSGARPQHLEGRHPAAPK